MKCLCQCLLPFALAALLLPSLAWAGTRVFRLTSYGDFDAGESKGLLVSSRGEVLPGYATKRIDVAAAFVRASATDPTQSSRVYFGTGVRAELWRFAAGSSKAERLAEIPDAVEITSLVVGPDGTVYLSATPGGRIFSWKNGKLSERVKLDAEHIWTLALSTDRKTLFAATGTRGKLYAVDVSTFRAKTFWQSEQKHLRALLVQGPNLFVGTSDEAILFRISENGKATVVHDFAGEEVRGLASHNGNLFVAVNQFDKPSSGVPPLLSRPVVVGTPPPPGTAGATSVQITAPPMGGGPAMTAPGGSRKGKGSLFQMDRDGRVDVLMTLGEGYLTDVVVAADGSVLAPSADKGKVYQVRPDRTVLVAFDVPERQVLSLLWRENIKLLGTGDAASLYEVTKGEPSSMVYTSKVLDAEFPSQWGQLRWRGTGTVQFEMRSSNTSKPDGTWSAWQKPSASETHGTGGALQVSMPLARFVQVRATISPAASLREVQIYYLPMNQRPRVVEVAGGDTSGWAASAPPPMLTPIMIGGGGGATPLPTAPVKTSRSPVVKLRWRVENPDNDELIYRVFYREDAEKVWKPIGNSHLDPLTRTEYDWNTEAIPDGNYVVRVVASDERANPKERALLHELDSEPFLVDNRKPEVEKLAVRERVVTGTAKDSFSPIRDLAYAIDGGPWTPVAPQDGVLDAPEEKFSIAVPENLAKGLHTLAVRATDGTDNIGTAQISFRQQ